jgi:hypothetical protein
MFQKNVRVGSTEAMKKILLILSLTAALVSCSEQHGEGVYVEISLDNEKDLNSYVLFNSNIKTVKECEASMEGALPSIMANLPKGIPMESTATGWKCSLTDPRKDLEERKSS